MENKTVTRWLKELSRTQMCLLYQVIRISKMRTFENGEKSAFSKTMLDLKEDLNFLQDIGDILPTVFNALRNACRAYRRDRCYAVSDDLTTMIELVEGIVPTPAQDEEQEAIIASHTVMTKQIAELNVQIETQNRQIDKMLDTIKIALAKLKLSEANHAKTKENLLAELAGKNTELYHLKEQVSHIMLNLEDLTK